MPKQSDLRSLTPLLDEHSILRVGERLRHTILSPDEQHPAILSRGSRLSALLVDACHRRTLHGGVQLTLSTLRQRYWIPGGRMAVRKCIHRCVPYLRWRASSSHPLMGDLPLPRVRVPPFMHIGVDYAGPVLLRKAKGRGQHAQGIPGDLRVPQH